jgi:hypothetical protein
MSFNEGFIDVIASIGYLSAFIERIEVSEVTTPSIAYRLDTRTKQPAT